MRGLTAFEREALLRSIPGHPEPFEWEDGDQFTPILDAVHEHCTRLGWMVQEEDGEDLVWTTTQRGRSALECDALVRASSGERTR